MPKTHKKSAKHFAWLIRRIFDRGVHLAVRASHLWPFARPSRFGVRLVRDVAYRPTGRRAHKLDVYVPNPKAYPGPRPVLVYVHGGAFSMLSKDTHRFMAMAFARQGYVVFNTNYRLGPVHAYPAPLEDAAEAVLFAARHAERYGGDAGRLVLAGESAGGNLVTALVYCATHPRPEPFARALYDAALPICAALPIYGMLDMTDLRAMLAHPRLPSWMKREIILAAAAYVGGRPVRERAKHAPLASPLARLAEPPPDGARPLPPFFIACGTADPLLAHSKQLADVLRARGATVKLSVHPGEIHGFNAMFWRKEARAKWHALFSFLRAHAPAR